MEYFKKAVEFIKGDARHFQILFLGMFLTYGLLFLSWDFSPSHVASVFIAALASQIFWILISKAGWDSLKSALITALGLSILLKGQNEWVLAFAAFLAIQSKFVFRLNGKHFFNPANFGIVVSAYLTGQTWTSPGQWGSGVALFLFVAACGLLVLHSSSRLGTGLLFLAGLFTLDFLYYIAYQGWPMDFVWHKYTNGSLLLFSFFMITDPRSTPSHPFVRHLWVLVLSAVSFYLTSFYYLQNVFIKVLFVGSLFTPLLDKWFKYNAFQWKNYSIQNMKTKNVITAVVLALLLSPLNLSAFCGFYVAKAGSEIYNNKSEVILVRNGKILTVTMSNDFKGNVKDFAMVVPVPEVLRERDIKVVDRSIFASLDAYSAPRLVEYYDQNPCGNYRVYEKLENMSSVAESNVPSAKMRLENKEVKIEASYSIGEYDILILSSTESKALKTWLKTNGYAIPENAEEVLDPYIKDNLKFFVVKVNVENMKKGNFDYLRPIQITYESERFMLPIRLGMANAQGAQDLLVYAFSKTGRIETSNYRTVKMPTGNNIPTFVLQNFSDFYSKTFDHQYAANNEQAVFLEYAWEVTPTFNGMKCDPCIGPPPMTNELNKAGVSWGMQNSGEKVYFTRLHVRYTRNKFPQDLQFIETPNKENYQARYVITHPAYGEMKCKEGMQYQQKLLSRQKSEVFNYAQLTNQKAEDFKWYYKDASVSSKVQNKWGGVFSLTHLLLLWAFFLLSALAYKVFSFLKTPQKFRKHPRH